MTPPPNLPNDKTKVIILETCKNYSRESLAGPVWHARAQVHNFICSENRGFPSPGDLCREVI